MSKTVAVCGAGRGGMTMAADLTLMGHSVRLFQLPRFAGSLDPIRDNKGIKISGHTSSGKTGTVMPELVTTDPVEALQGAEVVMIVSPVFGHEAFMEILAPYFEDGQIVVFNTGYWASLRFRSLIQRLKKDVILSETMALVYLTFGDGPGAVKVHATKQMVSFAAMPAAKTDEALARVGELYPQFVKSANILETNLRNGNPIFHIPIMTLNVGTVENLEGKPFYFYRDGATRRVCEVLEEVDRERIALCRALGVDTESHLQQMIRSYGHMGARGNSIYEVIKNDRAYKEFAFDPADVLYEVAREDIPYGLMPMVSLAEQIGVAMPTIKSLIHLQALMTDDDFSALELGLEELGLKDLSASQILKYVENGEK
jgi:opine dehydrogenase